MDSSDYSSGKHHWWTSITILIVSLALGAALGWLIFSPDRWPPPPEPAASVTVAANDERLFTTLPTPVGTPLNRVSAPIEGAIAPDFTLPTLGGGETSLSQFRGRPVLINFWASWCPPCRLEMPDLVRAYEAHQDDGFVILAIDLTFQNTLADVEAFVAEFNMTFPVLLDGTGEVTNDLYRLRGLPLSVFVKRDGRIGRIHVGGMTGEQIDQFVAELLVAETSP